MLIWHIFVRRGPRMEASDISEVYTVTDSRATASTLLLSVLLRFKTELVQFVPGFSVAHSNKSKYVSLGGTSGLAKNRLSKARDTFSPFFAVRHFGVIFTPIHPVRG